MAKQPKPDFEDLVDDKPKEKSKPAKIVGYAIPDLSPTERENSRQLFMEPVFSSEEKGFRRKIYKTLELARVAAYKKYPEFAPKIVEKKIEIIEEKE